MIAIDRFANKGLLVLANQCDVVGPLLVGKLVEWKFPAHDQAVCDGRP
jgi:hypothetical protein